MSACRHAMSRILSYAAFTAAIRTKRLKRGESFTTGHCARAMLPPLMRPPVRATMQRDEVSRRARRYASTWRA